MSCMTKSRKRSLVENPGNFGNIQEEKISITFDTEIDDYKQTQNSNVSVT